MAIQAYLRRLTPIACVVLGLGWGVLALWPTLPGHEIRTATAGPVVLFASGLLVAVAGVVGAKGGYPRLPRYAAGYSIALSTIGIVRLPEVEWSTTGILVGVLAVSSVAVLVSGRDNGPPIP